jgi:hypothetical protein
VELSLPITGGNKPWVARVTGRSERFGYERTFLPSRGSPGHRTWELADGTYDVCCPRLGGRYYAEVSGGVLRRLSDDDTICCSSHRGVFVI